jgi:hypothetical protein
VRREQLAQTCGVLLAELDFIRLAVERERHRLVRFAAADVVYQPDHDHLRYETERNRSKAGPQDELQHCRGCELALFIQAALESAPPTARGGVCRVCASPSSLARRCAVADVRKSVAFQ